MTYAIARVNRFRVTDDPEAREHRSRFEADHAAQPGFLGSLSLPLNDGSELILNLWEDEASARAALSALAPTIEAHLQSLLAAPSHLLGAGPITGLDAMLARMPR